MEILYQSGKATANELMLKLSGRPSNSSVRTQLRILEEKGVVRHDLDDGKFVYAPVHPREEAAGSALSRVVKTFFRGSVSQTVAALLTQSEAQLQPEEIAELEALIARAKEEGR